MPELGGEVYRALYVDGIYLAKDLVVLIACTESHVVSWYMAQRETSRAWENLVAPIPAPEVVVSRWGMWLCQGQAPCMVLRLVSSAAFSTPSVR